MTVVQEHARRGEIRKPLRKPLLDGLRPDRLAVPHGDEPALVFRLPEQKRAHEMQKCSRHDQQAAGSGPCGKACCGRDAEEGEALDGAGHRSRGGEQGCEGEGEKSRRLGATVREGGDADGEVERNRERLRPRRGRFLETRAVGPDGPAREQPGKIGPGADDCGGGEEDDEGERAGPRGRPQLKRGNRDRCGVQKGEQRCHGGSEGGKREGRGHAHERAQPARLQPLPIRAVRAMEAQQPQRGARKTHEQKDPDRIVGHRREHRNGHRYREIACAQIRPDAPGCKRTDDKSEDLEPPRIGRERREQNVEGRIGEADGFGSSRRNRDHALREHRCGRVGEEIGPREQGEEQHVGEREGQQGCRMPHGRPQSGRKLRDPAGWLPATWPGIPSRARRPCRCVSHYACAPAGLCPVWRSRLQEQGRSRPWIVFSQ